MLPLKSFIWRDWRSQESNNFTECLSIKWRKPGTVFCRDNQGLLLHSGSYLHCKLIFSQQESGETVSDLERILGPWLHRADDDIPKLNNEKFVDQMKIINLQNQLIEKQKEQLSVVKTTVATEMKSYSSAVLKS